MMIDKIIERFEYPFYSTNSVHVVCDTQLSFYRGSTRDIYEDISEEGLTEQGLESFLLTNTMENLDIKKKKHFLFFWDCLFSCQSKIEDIGVLKSFGYGLWKKSEDIDKSKIYFINGFCRYNKITGSLKYKISNVNHLKNSFNKFK